MKRAAVGAMLLTMSAANGKVTVALAAAFPIEKAGPGRGLPENTSLAEWFRDHEESLPGNRICRPGMKRPPWYSGRC